jgi:hypothetical protein
VVASVVAPHDEVEAEVKFVPVMVSVKAALPATAVAGLRLPMEGSAANAAGVHANARITEKATVDQRMNERALRICNHLCRVKLSFSRHSKPKGPYREWVLERTVCRAAVLWAAWIRNRQE